MVTLEAISSSVRSQARRAQEKTKDAWERLTEEARSNAWRVQCKTKDAWQRLTEGAELQDLWVSFKTEAQASSKLYLQGADWKAVKAKESWKRPFAVIRLYSWGLLKKLSPARRLLLLLSLSFACLALVGLSFFPLTTPVEFLLALAGLLLLLGLELADHVTMRRDLEIAHEIQRWLVPRVPPDIPGVDMAFAMRSAKTVGGDYYDAFRRASDGPLLIAVADVAGKSVPAAMLMATFQASLRTLAGARSSLAELVGGLNRYACATSNGRRFTTAFIAELDPGTGALSYICAGHNAPILRRSDGTIERLKAESIPLGIELDEHYETGKTSLKPSDLLVIYTDGVVEAANERGERFEERRLIPLVQPVRDERAAATLSSLMRSLDEFVGPAEQHDDITFLLLRRT
jgi:phosphoserine phosphatase RsbU/P